MCNKNTRWCQLNLKIYRPQHMTLQALLYWHATLRKKGSRIRIWIRIHLALLDKNFPWYSVWFTRVCEGGTEESGNSTLTGSLQDFQLTSRVTQQQAHLVLTDGSNKKLCHEIYNSWKSCFRAVLIFNIPHADMTFQNIPNPITITGVIMLRFSKDVFNLRVKEPVWTFFTKNGRTFSFFFRK